MAGKGIALGAGRALPPRPAGRGRAGRPTRLGRWAATAVVLLGAFAGCASDGSGPAQGETRAGQPMPADQRQALRTSGAPATLSDLRDVDELKALFNQHQDVPQLVLLLSPT